MEEESKSDTIELCPLCHSRKIRETHHVFSQNIPSISMKRCHDCGHESQKMLVVTKERAKEFESKKVPSMEKTYAGMSLSEIIIFFAILAILLILAR